MTPPVSVVANKLTNRQRELEILERKLKEGALDPRVKEQIINLQVNLQTTRAEAMAVGIGKEWIKAS